MIVISCPCVLLVASCADDEAELPCVSVSTECSPIVSPPTFDAIYANILRPSCASGVGDCHGSASPRHRLDMSTADAAYDGLRARVTPGDVSCSLLVKRVESSSPTLRMPPGSTPLSEPQRCAIRKWVAEGARR